MTIRRKRILLYIVILICLIGLLFTAVYLKSVADYQKAVKETTFSDIDISKISDGVYVGAYDVGFVSAKVEVTVHNGAVTSITILRHQNERGKSAEIVADRMIEEQKIDVDTVSGATNSSVVIKKAVENALKGEKQK